MAQQYAGLAGKILLLYKNTGGSYGQLTRVDKQIEYYETGLTHAQSWLAMAQQHAGLADQILGLYDNHISSFGNQRLAALVIDQLPYLGVWSWVGLRRSEVAGEIAHNWRNHLSTDHDPEVIAQGCRQLWEDNVTRWHQPEQPQRVFPCLDTEDLLALAETLYLIEQSEYHKELSGLLERWENLSDFDGQNQQLRNKIQAHEQKIEQLTLALSPVHSTRLRDKLWHWPRRYFLRKQQQEQHTLRDHAQQKQYALANNPNWLKEADNLQKEILKILHHNYCQQYSLDDELWTLHNFSALTLALLSLTTDKPDEEWQDTPIWQQPERLRSFFAAPAWQSWLVPTSKFILKNWLLSPLNPNPKKAQFIQRHLSPEFSYSENFDSTLHQTLQQLTQQTDPALDPLWQQNKEKTKQLLPFFQTFTLHAQTDEDTLRREILTACLLGDIGDYLKRTLEQELAHLFPLALEQQNITVTFAALNQRLHYLVAHYEPLHSRLGEYVHNWAAVRLKEQCQQDTISLASIWDTLERSRMGLMVAQNNLPQDWKQTIGKLAWDALRDSFNRLISDLPVKPADPWSVAQAWITQFQNWLQRVSISQCQQKLQAHQAIVQLFFDPNTGTLKYLTLTREGLKLNDLPEDCAQIHWYNDEETGVADRWMDHQDNNWVVSKERKTFYDWHAAENPTDPHWQATMNSNTVQTVANALEKYAKEAKCTQLFVIFPAPLGQLPWEALDQCAAWLNRAVSISHWFHQIERYYDTQQRWLFSLSPHSNLPCAVPEALWVEQHWHTQIAKDLIKRDSPEQNYPIFQAIAELKNSRQVWLITHGQYVHGEPRLSGLQLNGADKKENIDLPIWLIQAMRFNSELVVLSACVSNVTGNAAEGWLAPLGIGPALAAAGANRVIGTLWSVNEVSTFMFAHCLCEIQANHKELELYQQVEKAKQKMRTMKQAEFTAIVEQFKQTYPDTRITCTAKFTAFQSHPNPLSHYRDWAGFIVMG
ncbi:hypothetical protein TPSD3_03315 [Thioflexithrix psekupsensis]|uniref:CHAT domain-containing protein n=2 Tax=Thioflexithrix psekupsensis TaxID=1570016 RepID=A0A251XB93_9GAMM|nr:hypothetical protein TPSD3_03315 [Thioflexithrix psekupsensis]